jgi:hypothetical protein
VYSSTAAACQALAAPGKPPKPELAVCSQPRRSLSNSHVSPSDPASLAPPYRQPCASAMPRHATCQRTVPL